MSAHLGSLYKKQLHLQRDLTAKVYHLFLFKTMKKNIILVPTDFSEIATYALEHAIHVAKTFDNYIAILHVAEEGFLGSLFNKGYDGMIKEAIDAKLEACKKKCADQGIEATTHIKAGKIYKMVVEAADELGCDSIIMGTHGASGIEAIVGSNATKVMSASNVPVVIIKEASGSKGAYKNIVFPLDLTLESKQKIQWAVRLAKTYNSTIHLVSFKESDDFLSLRANANVVQIEKMLAEAGIKHTHKELESGSIAAQVLSYAEGMNADLIMIMAQQDKSFKEFFLGAYAQQIVNHSGSVPVMAINPKDIPMTGDYMG
jgi:nucleotide-binding universal stress UspA family protein